MGDVRLSVDFRENRLFCLAFKADPSDESSCANRAQKKDKENQHDQRRNQHSRYRCGTGRARRAGKCCASKRSVKPSQCTKVTSASAAKLLLDRTLSFGKN
jgi:hypothetical protein